MTGWSPDYATLAELKAMLLPDGQPSPTTKDAAMGYAITAASRAIDHECNRQFGVDAAPTTRLYSYGSDMIDGRQALAIDDVMGAVAVSNISGVTPLTLLPTQLWPYNAAVKGRPYTHVLLAKNPTVGYPTGGAEVQVVATFGWTAVPVEVKQACLIQAGRFYVRRDSLYGIAGSPTTGSEVRLLARLDPDVALILSSVKRWWGAVSTGATVGTRLTLLDYYGAVGAWL